MAKPDLAVARLGKQQHGIVSIAQLRAAGISDDAVRGRVRAGRLHRIHRGVYALGHTALSDGARWMAAVLACARTERGGPPQPSVAAWESDDVRLAPSHGVLGFWGAAVSHRSAAELWGLLPKRDGPVDVSVAGQGGKIRRPGLRAHRSLTLSDFDVTLRGGIPVTKPARTIADLRGTAARGRERGGTTERELRRAIRQANVIGLPLEEDERRDRTRSDLERDFLRLCRRHGLPAPEVNVRIGPHLVDFLWRAQGLVVETDGFLYHSGRVAFEDDRGRDLDLRRLGYDVVRLADRQLEREPEVIAEVLRTHLASFRPHGRETRHGSP